MGEGSEISSLRAGQAAIDATIRALDERLEHVEHTLQGNGRAGLIESVNTIAAGIKSFKWLWATTVVPLFAALGGALIYELVRGH